MCMDLFSSVFRTALRVRIYGSLALSCTLFCATVSAQLPSSALKLLQDNNIPLSSIGVVVTRLADGTPVLTHNADASLAPASTIKTLTTIAGLEKLGPTYRARTEFRSEAKIEGAILQGDLILRGEGSTDFDWRAMQTMLQTLRHKGIKEIRGNLVIDRQWFQPARIDIGSPPFDESPEFQYNVIPDALLLNMNLLQVEITANATQVRADVWPKLDRVSIVSYMTLVERDCTKWENGWAIPVYSLDENGTIRIELKGEFPKNCSISTELNVIDRTQYADRLFRSLWRNLGGVFRGTVIEKNTPAPPTGNVLATHQSRTLAEHVHDINKRSDNPMTRVLYLTLGAMSASDAAKNGTADNEGASTATKANAEVRAWMRGHRIDDADLVLENGSGLSRKERIRPSQLAQVLTVASKSKWAPEFMSSLPIAAVDGGMKNRLRLSRAAEVARLKTGGLRDVAAIAGYVPDANNQSHVVVAMINHDNVKGGAGRAILDAIVDWVANSGVVTGAVTGEENSSTTNVTTNVNTTTGTTVNTTTSATAVAPR
jgi:serine-type D-Ala-D-Ala carboxypeptidase/endopeptidase (penicillin-binding protein 4)